MEELSPNYSKKPSLHIAKKQALLALLLFIFAAAYNYETPHSSLYFSGSAIGCTKLFEPA